VAATPVQYITDLVKPAAKPSHSLVLTKSPQFDDGDYEGDEDEGEGDDTGDDDATSPPASPRLEVLAYTGDDDSWSDCQEGQGEELSPLTDESKLPHIMPSPLIILLGITALDTESQLQEPSQPAERVAKKRQLSTSEEVSLLNFLPTL
jgi:hypothetical protein